MIGVFGLIPLSPGLAGARKKRPRRWRRRLFRVLALSYAASAISVGIAGYLVEQKIWWSLGILTNLAVNPLAMGASVLFLLWVLGNLLRAVRLSGCRQ